MEQIINTGLYKKIDTSANQVLEVLSHFIGVNTFCVTKVDDASTLITNVFNREKVLMEEGTLLQLEHAY